MRFVRFFSFIYSFFLGSCLQISSFETLSALEKLSIELGVEIEVDTWRRLPLQGLYCCFSLAWILQFHATFYSNVTFKSPVSLWQCWGSVAFNLDPLWAPGDLRNVLCASGFHHLLWHWSNNSFADVQGIFFWLSQANRSPSSHVFSFIKLS